MTPANDAGSIRAILRNHPAPKPGQRGSFKSFEAFCAYLQYHRYQVRGFRGDEIVIEPIPVKDDVEEKEGKA